MIAPIVTFIPTALLAAAAACAGVDLWRRNRPARIATLVLVVCALLLRIATFLEPGLCPVSATGGGMGLVALFLTLHFVFGFRVSAQDQTRMLALLLVILALDVTGQLLEPKRPFAPPARERAFGELHGGLVLLAYAAFLVAGVYSLLYLVLYRLMKRRRLGFWFDRLPSLSQLESRTAVAEMVGLAALTAGLAVGLFAFSTFRGGLPIHDPKVQVAAAVWLLFAAGVAGRRLLRWNGIRVMWVPLAGSLMIVVLASVSATEHPFWSAG